MSGIFGLIRFDGQPVTDAALRQMHQAMAFWGAGDPVLWRQAGAGIGVLHSSFPPDVSGLFPPQEPQQPTVIAACGRIDNQADLAAALPGAFGGQRLSDAEAIQRAYLHWGEQCIQRLRGDWTLAAWDERQDRLFLARDQQGISSLYYCRQPGFFAFASSIKALLALPEIPQRPDLQRLAQVLVSWPGTGSPTAYAGISQLPPAHALRVTATGIELTRYWRLEDTPPLRLASDQAYLDAFLEIYSEAVRCRLVSGEGIGAVGASLSSGLDSGSICALAARELARQGRDLPVFSSVPVYDTRALGMRNRYGDESPLIEQDRQFIGNLDLHYIRSEDFSPLTGLQYALDIHDSPLHAAGNSFWIASLLRSARKLGLEILLIGQAGNAVISWTGGVESLWPLLWPGRWSELRALPSRLRLPLWRLAWRHFIRPPLLPLSNGWTRLRAARQEPWTDNSAINPAWARSLDLGRQLRLAGHDPLFIPSTDPFQARVQIMQPGNSVIGTLWAENGAAAGLDVRDPTLDQRLAEFCLAIPDEQYRLDGLDRSLIRRAMQGLLPDAVRLNRRRGLQSADLGYRLLAELPQAQEWMQRLAGSPLAQEVLDLSKMNAVLQALQQEVNLQTTLQAGTVFVRGLMVGMFLLRFDAS